MHERARRGRDGHRLVQHVLGVRKLAGLEEDVAERVEVVRLRRSELHSERRELEGLGGVVLDLHQQVRGIVEGRGISLRDACGHLERVARAREVAARVEHGAAGHGGGGSDAGLHGLAACLDLSAPLERLVAAGRAGTHPGVRDDRGFDGRRAARLEDERLEVGRAIRREHLAEDHGSPLDAFDRLLRESTRRNERVAPGDDGLVALAGLGERGRADGAEHG